MKKRTLKWALTVIVSAAMTVALAACGNSSDSAGAGSSDGSTGAGGQLAQTVQPDLGRR